MEEDLTELSQGADHLSGCGEEIFRRLFRARNLVGTHDQQCHRYVVFADWRCHGR